MRNCLKDQKGFTLLELMVSFLILGVIVVIVAGAMRLGFRSVEAGEKKVDYLERLKNSMNIIDSQVQSAIPLTYTDNGEKKNYFEGEKDSMQFASNYSIWGGQRGYVVIKYTVESGTEGKQTLTASENVVGVEEANETKLLTADSIYFEYFYKDPTAEEGSWVESWTQDNLIPEKVKLHLVRGNKDFSLIIPMRAGTGTGGSSTVMGQQPGQQPQLRNPFNINR